METANSNSGGENASFLSFTNPEHVAASPRQNQVELEDEGKASVPQRTENELHKSFRVTKKLVKQVFH